MGSMSPVADLDNFLQHVDLKNVDYLLFILIKLT